MKDNTIKFNGTELVLKQSFKSLMMFETMTGKYATQVNESISDLTKLLYCMLSANNKETFKYSYDEFIDLLDNNLNVMEDFSAYLVSEAKKALPQEPKKKVKQ
jgi:hypothetical protein